MQLIVTKLKYNSMNILKRKFSSLMNGSLNKSSNSFTKGIEKTFNLMKKVNEVKIKFAAGNEKARYMQIRNQKLIVSDRLKILFDRGQYLEIGYFAGYGQTYGDIPKSGGISAIGYINNRICLVSASDSTIKGGAVFPIQLPKQLRLLNMAKKLRLPFIYIIDSGGAFLPLQAEIFPDKEHGGRIFYSEAVLQSKGIPVISLVCGSCIAGAAYIPTMSTENGMVLRTSHIFLGGPPLVKAALGEIISADDLGGAILHNKVSGCTDYLFQNETDGLQKTREIISHLPRFHIDSSNMDNSIDPLFSPEELNGLILNLEKNTDNSRLIMMQILARILDGSYLREYKSEYGTNLITGMSRISGYAVGIMACHGYLSEKESVKGSNFIQICGHQNIPIVSFIHSVADPMSTSNRDSSIDSDGFIVKAKSSLMRSISTRNCKLITVVIGDAVGLDYICLGGESMEPDFIIGWPNSRFGWTEMDLENTELSSVLKVAGNMKLDDIVEPTETRTVLTKYLEILHTKSNLNETIHPKPVYRF